MQSYYYLSYSRLGTLFHSLLYLVGGPVYLGDYNVEESSVSHWNNGNYLRALYLSFVSSSGPFSQEELCYDGFGCFSLRYPELRGFALFPDSIELLNPTVCHYSSTSTVNGGNGNGHAVERWCKIVNNETIHKLNITNGTTGHRRKTYWITHGYMENGKRPWIKEMVNELLTNDPTSNAFVLDWAEGAKPPYQQASVNIELVAVYAAKIMKTLQDSYGLDIGDTHVIAHSLGAHLAGFIGLWLNNKFAEDEGVTPPILGRITGLDPANPYFQGLPPDARLDKSDAHFVDVMHTDGRPMLEGGNIGVGLGMEDPVGHADFYPNNGRDQPGCKDGIYSAIRQEDGSFLYGLRRFFGCDHMRAYEYFVESINTKCAFMGYNCSSWEDFSKGNCGPDYDLKSNRLGFHAVPETGDETFPSRYYLLTGSKSPYCRDHYIVTIELEEESAHRSTSDIHLIIIGERGEEVVLTIDWRELRGGNLTYKYLKEGYSLRSSEPIRLVLRPAMSNPILWFVNRMGPKTPDLTIKYISIHHMEKSTVTTFCPNGVSSFSISDKNPQILFNKTNGNDCLDFETSTTNPKT